MTRFSKTEFAFAAEFYPDKHSDKVIYRTLLWGVEGNPEYIKEMSATDVAMLFPFKYNHELAEILLAGKPCKKAVVHAQQVESDNGGRKLFEINEKGECIKPKWT